MFDPSRSSKALVVLSVALALARCGGGGGTSSGAVGGGGGGSGSEQVTAADGDASTMMVATDDAGGFAMSTDAGFVAVADATSANAIAPTQEFPIAPLHLAPAANARNADAQVDVELRADGTIYSHGQVVGQLSGRRVLSPSGREILAIEADGTVTLGGTPTRARFREDGDVVMPTGAVLSFDPDGTPVAVAPGGARQVAPARVAGFRADLRRTAALLAVLAATVAMPGR